ncbi:carnitine O-acetyltransferase [Malassezia sp. CBS 17886]|nr:carnitine O-acetyltransferase [Malassezia sp. CBS 17886]
MVDGEKVTLSRQGELPKLPLPSLEDTCARYLKSLEALQTPEQHRDTKASVDHFLATDGPEMHAALEEYAKEHDSYIEEFWDDSYLMANDSVVLNLNPFFILEDEPDPERGSQLRRATDLVLATLSFVHDLRHELLEPDTFRGKPLDMYQYERLFGMARVPSQHGCHLEHYEQSRHIVVMRGGQFYWFEVLDDEDRQLLTDTSLTSVLKAIMRDADGRPREHAAQEALGVLSTERRRTWSRCRTELERNAQNRQCLAVVDSALFVLCLDDIAPTDVSELTSNMLCGSYRLQDNVQTGTCLNRWYDKLQIIVCANGTAGVNFEHSSTDGHTVLRFVADIYTELVLRFAHSINPATKSLFKAKTSPYARGAKHAAPPQRRRVELDNVALRTMPKRLEWAWSASIQKNIRFAEMRLSDLICQNEIVVLEFKGYGKQFITAHGFSPDAFVQMALQATYYALYGHAAPTYEPAMTKAFLRGRTETIRTVQPHTLRFIQTWTDPDASVAAKLDALRAACTGHVQLSRECAAGHGFDRHLYALRALWQKRNGADGKPLPPFFQESAYKLSNHIVLSTSNCGNPSLRIFGFGPVEPDGFGIGYIIQDHKITICASSKHLQTRRFLDALEQYFLQVRTDIIAYVSTSGRTDRSDYKSANAIPTQTYIDYRGIECDARTGLPVSSLQASRLNTTQAHAADVGSTGYSFYGDADETGAESKLQYNPRKTVGKLLFVSEYD